MQKFRTRKSNAVFNKRDQRNITKYIFIFYYVAENNQTKSSLNGYKIPYYLLLIQVEGVEVMN